MAYIPPPPPGAQAPARRGLGLAITAGAAVAIGCAFLAGLIGGETNSQFAYAAVILGLLVGVVIRKIRSDAQAAIAAGLLSLAGGALSSLISLTVRLVKVAHIPLSFVLAHISTVMSQVPHYIGAFGFLCWALAAYVGWATAAGRGRRRRAGRMRGRTAPAGQSPQPYGAGPGQQPYGAGTGPQPYGAGYGQQPHGTGSGQPYGTADGPGQQPYGAGSGQPHGAADGPGQQAWGSPGAQADYSGPGFALPGDQLPRTGPDERPGG